jgi:ureidoglycolate dehydrogenase (NAD+)
MNEESYLTVSHRELFHFIKRILEKKGVPSDEVKLIAETLVAAHLRGVDTHGVIRLPIYTKRLDAGSLRPKAKITMVRETPTIAVLNGHQSFGQVIGYRAMALAMEKAEHSSIGVVGVRNSEHFGAAAFFAMMALKKNMIGISITNTAPIMAPTGGASKLIGNNPIAVAIPAGKEPPVVLDVSMSIAALGKIILASQRGEKIPLGWGRDRFGALTDDPASILQGGSLFPLGEYKGYGLALVFDVLCGVLTGSGFTTEVLSIYKEIDKANRCGHFMMALKIKDFLPVALFSKQMGKMVRQIKRSPKAQGNDRIYLPGEIEFLTQKERTKKGLPIDRKLFSELNQIATELGVKPLGSKDEIYLS